MIAETSSHRATYHDGSTSTYRQVALPSGCTGVGGQRLLGFINYHGQGPGGLLGRQDYIDKNFVSEYLE